MQRRLFSILIALILFTATSRADVTLIDTNGWRVEGVEGLGLLPSPAINVSVSKTPRGAFIGLKISYALTTNTVSLVCELSSDRIRPRIPDAPAGGTFGLTSYWDCNAGYVQPLQFKALDVHIRKVKNARYLELTGVASNGTSMATEKLALLFMPPATNEVNVAVYYKLRATRDICVDENNREQGYMFNAVNLYSNYLAPDTNYNDVVRFNALISKDCFSFGVYGTHCIKKTKLLCEPLTNTDTNSFKGVYRFNGPNLWLVHTTDIPTNTPSLIVNFNSPHPGQLKAQAATATSTSPIDENVQAWAFFRDAKRKYRSHQTVGKFDFLLTAIPPGHQSCDN